MGKIKKTKVSDKNQELLLGIKKDDMEIKRYEKLLNIKKRKKKSFLTDLFSTIDDENSEEGEMDNKDKSEEDNNDEIDEEDSEMSDDDESIEECDNCDEEMEECDSISEEEPDIMTVNHSPKKEQIVNKSLKEDTLNEMHQKIKQNLLLQLNKLSEATMMKCLDGVEEIWNGFPRGDVRDVFIKQSVGYMKFICMDFAAFVVSLHLRLCKHTNLIAFYAENLVEKLTSYKQSNWENEDTFITILSIFKFIAYVTRLDTIDCNLILDLMTEIVNTFALPQLKVLAEVTSIIGFYIRKNSSSRCEAFVKLMREKMSVNLCGSGDLNEMKSYAEATVDKLTSAKSKSDVVYQSVEKYKKMMKKLSKSGAQSDTIGLQLSDFRGDNRVRWWLVGSAVDPSVAHNKSASVCQGNNVKIETFSEEDKKWNEMATSLGFNTDGKRSIFRALMRGKEKEDPEDIGDTMEDIYKLMKSSGGALAVTDNDVVNVVVTCLYLDTEFCPMYVSVLAALLDNHRRFRQIIKCKFWDVLAQPGHFESVRANCGHCVGQLISMANLPVNSLKKFNFKDESAANNAFMVAVISEVLEENWPNIAELMKQILVTISMKFVGNLRLFIKKHFLGAESGKFSKLTISKATKCMETLQELRRSNLSE